jgi:hypothetical protein
MLNQLDELFPPVLSFHLQNLYLRFNLYPENHKNFNVYKHLNNYAIHNYLDYLISSNIDYETLVAYIKGIDSY